MKDAAGIKAQAPTTAIATQNGIDPEDVDTQGLSRFSGKASWYGGKFHGRRSASGERFDCNNLTAAHRTLPFGTKLLVRNKRTGASCVVKVSDRGPYSHGRVIDLSMGAAKQLNMISSGVANVDVFVMN
ncbi:MAG: septal ring lytic transglycosylase RlpA family protein [Cyanobacteria bacterium TGS_CYA1]|nr:septal ring lytic transglycosylase RlpA family protein [Cyanobacteria bacterium TGS_CYA1]